MNSIFIVTLLVLLGPAAILNGLASDQLIEDPVLDRANKRKWLIVLWCLPYIGYALVQKTLDTGPIFSSSGRGSGFDGDGGGDSFGHGSGCGHGGDCGDGGGH